MAWLYGFAWLVWYVWLRMDCDRHTHVSVYWGLLLVLRPGPAGGRSAGYVSLCSSAACPGAQDVRLAQECVDARLTGFPAWTINGRTLSGEQTLDALEAELSKAPAAAPALAGS